MVEPGRPSVSTSARVVQLFGGQPVSITALLQTAATAAVTMTTSQSSPHSKLSGETLSVVGSCSSQVLCQTSSSSTQQNMFSESVADDVTADSLVTRDIIAESLCETTTFQLLSQDEVEAHGLHAVALGNDDAAAAATILQCSHGPDGQVFIPVDELGSSSLSRGFVMSPADTCVNTTSVSVQLVEETTRRRQLRLLKNKEAAKECRRKKKEYVRCLENRVAVLENQNRTLIDELKSLKELYCQKDLHS